MAVLLFFLASNSSAATSENFDIFPFKIQDEVFMASETFKYVDQFKYLSCVFFEDSMTLKFMNLAKFNRSELEEQSQKFAKSEVKEISESLKQFFTFVIDYIKLKNYIQSQQFKIDQELKNLIYKSDKENNCKGLGFSTKEVMHPWFEDIVKVEMYLKSRFKDNSFVVSNAELESELQKNPNQTKDGVYKKLLNNKRNLAVSIFLLSISKQYPHEIFWQ